MFKPKLKKTKTKKMDPKLKTDDKLYNRLSVDDAVVLLVDHQTGLLSLARDLPAADFQNNVLGLAKAAKYFNLPTILTTSFEDGPNGPLMPEIKEMFPEADYIARPGQINAWDNEDFVKAIEKTGRKQLIIAGIVTEVCVAFPALAAAKAGYDVFVVTDASGTFNNITREAAWLRMQKEGIELMSWFAVACELARDWRVDMEGLANLFHGSIPEYGPLMDSYAAAQAAKK